MRMRGKSGQSRVNVSYSPPSPQMLQPNCLQQAARSHSSDTAPHAVDHRADQIKQSFLISFCILPAPKAVLRWPG